MSGPWDAFADASPDDASKADEWGDFPDAEPAKRKPAKKPKTRGLFGSQRPQLVENALLQAPIATDGDTLADGDHRLRLLGVDAPEVKQLGYSPDGSTSPIGQQSRDYLQDSIANAAAAVIGPVAGASFGRTVAPLSIDGADYGQKAINSGNALAAPSYLTDDPERRFDYMQGERLARQNRLGLHGSYSQTPADFRDAPVRMPERETVAQFFDTPTPYAGLRPEVEKQVLLMIRDESIPLEEVHAYARENGAIMDADDVKASRAYFLEHGEQGTLVYSPAPKVLTDLGDGQGGASVRQFTDGFLASGLDEAGAVVDMLGGTENRENIWNSERRWADIWKNNQTQNSSILAHDEHAYPGTSTAAQIAGGLASGFALPYGAGARSVPALAKVGAVYGGAEGFLGTDGSTGERLVGAAKGAPLGAVVNAAGGKALQIAAPAFARGANNLRGNLASDIASVRGRLPSRSSNAASQGDEWSDFPDAMPAASDAPETIAMEAEGLPSLTQRLDEPPQFDSPRPLLAPTTQAQLRASVSRISPRDLLPIPSNMVEGAEELAASQAGRFIEARPPNERNFLTKTELAGMNGSVPKVGPVDLVGYIRLQGGISDAGDKLSKGGDLKAIGMNNAARRGMDFVGQETRFGALVDDDGMSLDRAAESAWEAGYFPDFDERPTNREFLDALRETYEGGGGRRFHPDDFEEIENFYSAQADRFAVDQQRYETGQPVYEDKSFSPDEAQPFPPVEAYEEWGPAAPDFAGNIRLEKLDSPQSIARALAQTERTVGFDAARRGRITHQETERLASELNLTPEKLLARRKGQAFNAEEALAARQVLAKSGNELVNFAKRVRGLDEPGDEMLAEFRQKLSRHAAIQEQVSGMTAEAGRALSQFRRAASAKAVRGDVLNALVRAGGGADNLKDAADVLIDAAETSPGVFNALAAKATQPKWKDKISEFYINMLLSGPQTHAVNMAGNTLTMLAQIPEYAGGAVIGAGRKLITGNGADRVTTSEVGARAFGLIQGAKEGALMFGRALKSGEASDFASKVEGDQFKAIKGMKGEVIRVPTRFLTAEDELFKGIARRMELNAQAVRIARKEGLKGGQAKTRIAELVADPTDEMFEQALDYGRYLTFQRKLGPVGQSISNLTNESLVAKVFLPFVRTPTNLIKFAAERSPAAPLLREWRKDMKAGGARRDMAIARSTIGTGMAMLFYQAALDGLITGSAPSDPKKARLLYADGWKPNSVRVGDTYYSYSRMDPFSTTLGVAADMATLPEGMSQRQRDDQTTLLVASIMGNLASKTWLSGVSSLTEALNDPGRYADNLMQRLAGSFTVPAMSAQIARTNDPVMRQRESMGEAIQARIPGLSDDLLPVRDIWGQEITSDGSLGPDILSPIWKSHAKNDPVNTALLEVNYAPGKPSRTVGGRELSSQEYDRYVEQSGKASYSRLSQLVQSPAWEAMDSESKVKAAKKVVSGAREDARAAMGGGSLPTAKADEWAEFEDATPSRASRPSPPQDDEWSAFNDVPQRDVIGSLRGAIPGVGITSGFRTKEYQADMRRRGYKPAANSSHLDGSSLDLVPPAGKSMGWLRSQVLKVEPNAQILNEGDHLHVTFENWWGAPAIGNAKAAGLSNPAARQ